MNKFYIFLIRAILGAFFAVVLTHFFHPEKKILFVASLGVFMVGLAYLLEYWRKRKFDK